MYILTKFIKLSQRKGCDGGNKSRENELPVLFQKRKKKQLINSSLGWGFHCRKKYMVRVFCRQNLQLIFTVIEAKIIFLKSCNFLIWSRLHSKLSLDNYTYKWTIIKEKGTALNVFLYSVIELWLYTICLPTAIIKSMHSLRSNGSQPRWLPHENEISRHIINPKNNSQEPLKNKPPQGAPSTFLLTVSMSVTCTPTNKQIPRKMVPPYSPHQFYLQGLAHSETRQRR